MPYISHLNPDTFWSVNGVLNIWTHILNVDSFIFKVSVLIMFYILACIYPALFQLMPYLSHLTVPLHFTGARCSFLTHFSCSVAGHFNFSVPRDRMALPILAFWQPRSSWIVAKTRLVNSDHQYQIKKKALPTTTSFTSIWSLPASLYTESVAFLDNALLLGEEPRSHRFWSSIPKKEGSSSFTVQHSKTEETKVCWKKRKEENEGKGINEP